MERPLFSVDFLHANFSFFVQATDKINVRKAKVKTKVFTNVERVYDLY